MRIDYLRVCHLENPLGFRLDHLVCSWRAHDAHTSDIRHWRIIVRASEQIVCDTGWTALDPFATELALELVPRQRYSWAVGARLTDGNEVWSDPAWFETGKRDEAWQARWITCDASEPRHPIFTRDIALTGTIASARLYLMGLGLFDVYIGGQHVGNEYLAPGTHAYDQWLQVHTLDVTRELAASTRIEIHIGNGWWKGRFGFIPVDQGFYGNDWRLLAELRITYTDGHEDVVGSDERWQVLRSTITASSIYDGEHRDDTLPDLPVVPATLLDEQEAAAATAKLSDRLSLPIRAHEIFAPVLLHTPAGETVLDMGQNFAGTFRLRVHEPAGARIRIQTGELLQDGNFYRDNLRSARSEYVYVSDGEEHVLEPRFTYFGYRYLKVEGVRDLAPEACHGIALYSDIEPAGHLETGNALVNQLISNITWSMKSNFVDTSTDCPQRDERMGWTGDAQVFAPTALYLADQLPFYRKYLHDMALEQAVRDGATPMASPCFMLGTSPAIWGDATCTIPWNAYVFTGDASILAEHLDAMMAWVDYVARIDGDHHGWGTSFQFGDWLALDGPKGSRIGATDEGFIAYLYWWRSTILVAQAAAVLGKTELADRYRKRADAIADWIREDYYSATGRCSVNTQTAYVLSIVSGFGSKDFSGHTLARQIELAGNQLTTGFIGTEFLLRALCETGQTQTAYDLLLNEGCPGWLYSVKLGATTIWEHWNSLDETGHINTEDTMNSMNHYSYGAVGAWLFGWAAGLRPVEKEPGFRRAIVDPRPSWRLGHLVCTHACSAGTWRVAWTCVDEEHLTVEISVPFGCTAEVRLPLANEDAYEALGGHELGTGNWTATYRTNAPLRRVPSIDWPLAHLMAAPDTKEIVERSCYHPEWIEGADALQSIRNLAGRLGKHGAALRDDALEALDRSLRALAEPDPVRTVPSSTR